MENWPIYLKNLTLDHIHDQYIRIFEYIRHTLFQKGKLKQASHQVKLFLKQRMCECVKGNQDRNTSVKR